MVLARVRWLASSPFTRVVSGTGVGQLAMAAALPVVARLYDPGAIAALGLALVWCQWVGILFSAGLERLLPKTTRSIQVTVVRLMLVLTAVTGVVAGFVIPRVIEVSFGGVTLLAASMVATKIVIYAALSKRDYHAVTRAKVVQGLSIAAGQILGGIFWPTADALLVAHAAGMVAGAAVGAAPLVSLLRVRVAWLPGPLARREVVRFASRVGPSTLLTNVALNIPLIGLEAVYGAQAAATYFLARRILAVPSQLISRSLSEVSYAEVAHLTPAERYRRINRWSRLATHASLPLIAVGVVLVGAMQFLVGDKYPGIMLIAVILLVPSVSQAVGTAFASVLYALDEESWLLAWSALRVIVLATAIAILGIIDVPFEAGVFLLSAVGVVAYWQLMRRSVSSARRAAAA